MRRPLLSPDPAQTCESNSPSWISLAGLCCQAAGGDPSITDKASAAWVLLYSAAHLLDGVQDEDDPDLQENRVPGLIINVAIGHILSAVHLLEQLHVDGVAPKLAQKVTLDFTRTVLKMCSGQHEDLVGSDPCLEDVWRIAEAKSGAFFALACRAGATLAAIDDRRTAHYSSFGNSLGLMIQIGDDLRDLDRDATRGMSAIENGRWSLPIAYFMEVASVEDRRRMRALASESLSGDALRRLIAGSGAELYFMAKAEEQRHRAQQSLQDAGASGPAREGLEELLEKASIIR